MSVLGDVDKKLFKFCLEHFGYFFFNVHVATIFTKQFLETFTFSSLVFYECVLMKDTSKFNISSFILSIFSGLNKKLASQNLYSP